MTTGTITCPKCNKEVPDSRICMYCGEVLDPFLRKKIGKESLEKLMESERNQSFFGREQKIKMEKNDMNKCVTHIWTNHPDSAKKVVCNECGSERYKSKLSEVQLAALEPKLDVTPFDILMWVGSSYYKLEDFIEEARRIGCCKRIPKLPLGVIPGITRVFLLYEDVGIFGYFTVRGITCIIEPGTNIPEELKKRGVKEWEYQGGEFGFNDERGCGSLAVG